MGKLILSLCLCACLSVGVLGLDIAKSYNARVYDYTPATDITVQEIMFKNVQNIINEVDKNKGTDIFVFPEYGITGTDVFSRNNLSEFAIKIPDVDTTTDLCRRMNIHQLISDLACIDTLQKGAYLVVNFLENSDGDIYNTNIALQKGAIVAKYRKINLNQRESRLKAGTESVTFKTAFGTFGLITSDDVLHRKPAQDIFNDMDVTEVIMTSAWQSEVPFYTSVGLHDGYAKKNGINLLVSSISNPEYSQGGSGFYTVKGGPTNIYVPTSPGINPVRLTIEVESRRQPEKACNPLIVPRQNNMTRHGLGIGNKPSIDRFITQAMKNIDQYTFKTLLKSENNYKFEDEFCKGKLCCKFVISYDRNVFDILPKYKVIVSNSACGLIACGDEEDLSTCGSRSNELSRATFNSVTIEAKVEGKENNQYLPVSSNLELKYINYRYCESSSELKMETESTNDGLVFLGFIAPGDNSAAHHVVINFGLLGIVTLFLAIYNRIM